MAKTDNVVPHSSWGTMSQELRQIWTNLACDLLLHPDVPEHKPVVIPLDARFGLTNRSETKHPIIGIAVCTTTRKTTVQTLQEMSLFADLFPSLVATAEPNYEYWMYVLFDAGDPVLDNSAKIEEMATLFDTQVRQELIDKADIKSRLVLLRFNNEEAKPGPAFNFITQAAYEDGVDYIYRINDDTVFVDKNWPSALTGALASLSPPNVGVAGPFGINKPSILEHDFTHRIHHDIFPLHYPPILSDWWMDDWITRVYGRSRSKRVDNAKVNHNHRHGTRYDVDRSHGPLLDLEITRGRLVIEKWMHKVASNPESFSYNFTVTESDIEQYHRDVFKFSN